MGGGVSGAGDAEFDEGRDRRRRRAWAEPARRRHALAVAASRLDRGDAPAHLHRAPAGGLLRHAAGRGPGRRVLGFDAFFRSDHYLSMGDATGCPARATPGSPWPASPATPSRIRLGTLVTSATFRLPGPLAITVAGVDAMSGGRVELGLGAGWYEAEHTAYGIPFPPGGRALRAPGGAAGRDHRPVGHAGRGTFTFEGQHYQLVDSPALPKPVQRPGPPIIVGGHGAKRTPRLAATYAAEFNLAFSSLEETGDQFERVRRPAGRQGRDPARWSSRPPRWCAAAATEAEVSARAAAIGREVGRAADQRAVRLARRGGGQAGHLRRGGGRARLPADPRPRRPRPPGAHRRGGAAPLRLAVSSGTDPRAGGGSRPRWRCRRSPRPMGHRSATRVRDWTRASYGVGPGREHESRRRRCEPAARRGRVDRLGLPDQVGGRGGLDERPLLVGVPVGGGLLGRGHWARAGRCGAAGC